jgi:hypothetical protein
MTEDGVSHTDQGDIKINIINKICFLSGKKFRGSIALKPSGGAGEGLID